MMVLAEEWPSIRTYGHQTLYGPYCTCTPLPSLVAEGGCVERGCVATCGETSSKLLLELRDFNYSGRLFFGSSDIYIGRYRR